MSGRIVGWALRYEPHKHIIDRTYGAQSLGSIVPITQIDAGT